MKSVILILLLAAMSCFAQEVELVPSVTVSTCASIFYCPPEICGGVKVVECREMYEKYTRTSISMPQEALTYKDSTVYYWTRRDSKITSSGSMYFTQYRLNCHSNAIAIMRRVVYSEKYGILADTEGDGVFVPLEVVELYVAELAGVVCDVVNGKRQFRVK